MASTYSDLKIELIGTGDQTGTWGTTTNNNFSIALSEAITGSADVAFSSGDVTVTLTDTNGAQAARNLRLNLTGTSGGARELILGSGCQIEKLYLINNGLADAVTVKNTSGTGIAVPAGKSMFVYNNATNVVDATTYLSSLTLGAALPVASGGTGLTALGTGVATFLGTPSSANLASALTDETGTGVAVFGTNPTLTGVTLAGEAACADNLVTRATLKDYAVEGSAIGNTGATRTFDLAVANFFSATLDQACTFTFSNPPASGDFGCFVLELTNGGAFAITYPASVDFIGGVAPTLTASGKDQLAFTTRDGGTTYFAFVAGLDIKSP
jgi:hypothetical protein